MYTEMLFRLEKRFSIKISYLVKDFLKKFNNVRKVIIVAYLFKVIVHTGMCWLVLVYDNGLKLKSKI